VEAMKKKRDSRIYKKMKIGLGIGTTPWRIATCD